MATEYYLAFWNLENLFDIEHSPRRNPVLEASIKNDLVGWTQPLLNKKINQLASIIKKMNGGNGPDILGVCEVENKFVMDSLVAALNIPGRSYKVKHADTKDKRGIDVGFIFDSKIISGSNVFHYFVMRRTFTRDIVQVTFQTKQNRKVVLLGNHWPSRSGGQEKSEGYRCMAGETLAYFHERIIEELGDDTPVLAMGDFNDEPFNRSLMEYALSAQLKQRVTRARNWMFYNLMWDLIGAREGTLYFGGAPNVIDQFLANKNLLKSSSDIKIIPGSVEIVKFPEMISGGAYPEPIRFGGMGKAVNTNGYSDHFPVGVKLSEKD